MQASSVAAKSTPPVAPDAPQVLGRELDRRERVLHLVRHLAGHLGPGGQAVAALEVAPLAVQVAGHLVEGLDQPLQLVLAGGADAGGEVALRDAAGGLGELADGAGDAPGHRLGEQRRPGRRRRPRPGGWCGRGPPPWPPPRAGARPGAARGCPARRCPAARAPTPPGRRSRRSARCAGWTAGPRARARGTRRPTRAAPAGRRRTARACWRPAAARARTRRGRCG